MWHKSLAVDWPVLPWRRSLRDNGDWSCTEIELPEDPDHAVLEWCRRAAGRDIEPPPLRPVLIAPVPIDRTWDDVPIIPSGSEVIIGLPVRHGSPPPEWMHVELAGTGSFAVPLAGPLPIALTLGQVAGGSLSVSLPDHRVEPLNICVQATTMPHEIEAAYLVFESVASASKEILPVYTPEALQSLAEVRNGTRRLAGVQLPTRAVAHVYGRQGLGGPYEDLSPTWTPVTESSSSTDLASEPLWRFYREQVRQAMSGLLANPEAACRFDFGNYGLVVLQPAADKAIVTANHDLPAALRDRLQWLLSFPIHPGPVTTASDGIQLLGHCTQLEAYAQLKEPAKRLIKLLLGRQVWSQSAEPHLRAVARDLFTTLRDTPYADCPAAHTGSATTSAMERTTT